MALMDATTDEAIRELRGAHEAVKLGVDYYGDGFCLFSLVT